MRERIACCLKKAADECGLRIDPVGIRSVREQCQRAIGPALADIFDLLPSEVSERVRTAQAQGSYANGLESVGVYASNAWTVGENLGSSVGATNVRECGRIAARFRLFMQIFDLVCDEFGSQRARLCEIFSSERIQSAMRPDRSNDPAFETVDTDVDVIRAGISIGEAAFDDVRRVGQRCTNGMRHTLFEELRSAILVTYHAELIRATTRVGPGQDLSDVRSFLYESSALPIWAMARLVILASNVDRVHNGLDTALRLVATTSWMLDDLTDIDDDAMDGTWNILTWLGAMQAGPGYWNYFEDQTPDQLVDWLFEHGTVDRVAADVVASAAASRQKARDVLGDCAFTDTLIPYLFGGLIAT